MIPGHILSTISRVESWLRMGARTPTAERYELPAAHQIEISVTSAGRILVRYCNPTAPARGWRAWQEFEVPSKGSSGAGLVEALEQLAKAVCPVHSDVKRPA